jgi:hypothetical protein
MYYNYSYDSYDYIVSENFYATTPTMGVFTDPSKCIMSTIIVNGMQSNMTMCRSLYSTLGLPYLPSATGSTIYFTYDSTNIYLSSFATTSQTPVAYTPSVNSGNVTTLTQPTLTAIAPSPYTPPPMPIPTTTTGTLAPPVLSPVIISPTFSPTSAITTPPPMPIPTTTTSIATLASPTTLSGTSGTNTLPILTPASVTPSPNLATGIFTNCSLYMNTTLCTSFQSTLGMMYPSGSTFYFSYSSSNTFLSSIVTVPDPTGTVYNYSVGLNGVINYVGYYNMTSNCLYNSNTKKYACTPTTSNAISLLVAPPKGKFTQCSISNVCTNFLSTLGAPYWPDASGTVFNFSVNSNGVMTYTGYSNMTSNCLYTESNNSWSCTPTTAGTATSLLLAPASGINTLPIVTPASVTSLAPSFPVIPSSNLVITPSVISSNVPVITPSVVSSNVLPVISPSFAPSFLAPSTKLAPTFSPSVVSSNVLPVVAPSVVSSNVLPVITPPSIISSNLPFIITPSTKLTPSPISGNAATPSIRLAPSAKLAPTTTTSSATPPCPKGRIYDVKKKRCIVAPQGFTDYVSEDLDLFQVNDSFLIKPF